MWNRLCGNAVCSYGAGDTGGLLLFNATSASETLLRRNNERHRFKYE